MKTKFIFITGGVLSSLGKGLAAASIGALLEARGLRITIQKLDPYINVDPGTMNPFQHGEVFVTDDSGITSVTPMQSWDRGTTTLQDVFIIVLSQRNEGETILEVRSRSSLT
jgi:hypothetical protein